MQRHVKQAHGFSAAVQVMRQGGQLRAPVFAHGPKLFARFFAQRLQPVRKKRKADVLHSVQPEAVHPGLVPIPFAPAVQLGHHFGVAHVQVCPHQVIVVAVFAVHLAVPAFAFKLKHALFSGAVVPIHPVEVRVVPLKGRILAPAAGEGEFRPGGNGRLGARFPAPVAGVARFGVHLFAGVRTHAVVQHHVCQHGKALALQGAHGGKVFLFCAILGGHAALLVKFPQVVQVVYAIAHVIAPRRALVGRRQPHARKARLAQVRRVGSGALPMARVCGQVPFKILQKGFWLHCVRLPV